MVSSNLDTGFYSLGDSRQISFMWSEIILSFLLFLCCLDGESAKSLQVLLKAADCAVAVFGGGKGSFSLECD